MVGAGSHRGHAVDDAIREIDDVDELVEGGVVSVVVLLQSLFDCWPGQHHDPVPVGDPENLVAVTGNREPGVRVDHDLGQVVVECEPHPEYRTHGTCGEDDLDLLGDDEALHAVKVCSSTKACTMGSASVRTWAGQFLQNGTLDSRMSRQCCGNGAAMIRSRRCRRGSSTGSHA